ncbi:MAG: hypothetical protein ACREEB_12235 [Caulobacteraceae bacterium]
MRKAMVYLSHLGGGKTLRNGDQVVLAIRQPPRGARLILRVLSLEGDDIFAISSLETTPGRPVRLQLDPRKVEAAYTTPGEPMLYFYQEVITLND